MFSVALDGPAGAGKSTIAKEIAKKFQIIHVDTGAMYRAIALYFIKHNIDTKDINSIVPKLDSIKISINFTEQGQRIYINNEDITDDIRTAEVSMGASNVSAIPEVRAFLLDTQRDLAKHNSVIMDGRDIGTVILPDATVKIFLTAKAEVRATRRLKEYQEKDENVSFEEVLRDVIKRDENDSSRATAPLKQADDAFLVDTSDMDFNQSVEYISNIIKERTQK